MQSSSSSRPFKPGLIGASPITDAIQRDEWRVTGDEAVRLRFTRHPTLDTLRRSQSVISSARRSAKAEVRGANPRESASFQNPKSEIRNPKEFRNSKPETWPPGL